MKLYALLMALSIAFLWGLSPVIHKRLLQQISHHTSLVVSSVFYSVCIVIYAWYNWDHIYKDRHIMSVKILALLAFTAIICGFLTNVLYFMVLKRYESHIVSALIYSSPVFTLVLAVLLLRERVSFYGFLGVAFITIGILFLAFNRSGDEAFAAV